MMRFKRVVPWLAPGLAALLAGCLSAPTPPSPEASWTPPERAVQPDDLWQAVRAGQPDLSKALSLAELADVALRFNPATRKAWSEARAAAAQVEKARGYFMPTIVGSAAVSRQYTAAKPAGFDQDYYKYIPGLQVSYLILNFGGGRDAAVEAALQTVYAADFTFNRALQTVLLGVETAYYGLISAQAGVEAAEANLKDAQAVLAAAKERLAAGVGTQLEVLQAQAGNDQSQYGLVGERGAFHVARGVLAQALGLPADAPVRVKAPTADLPEAVAVPDMTRLIDESLRRRPDIAALRATLAAKASTATAVGSELWPSLYLSGSANRNYFDVRKGRDMQEHDWDIFASLSLRWTLFDGFQTINARRMAEAQAAAVEAQLKQAELAASVEVWTRYYAYETAVQKHTFSVAFLKSATAAHEAALDSYKAGLKSILDVLNAESQLAQARRLQAAARQEVFAALAQLAYAAGLLEKDGAAAPRRLFSSPDRKDQHP